MCEKCANLDLRIQKFRRYMAQPFDALTIERLKVAIEEMEAAKADYHSPSHQ